MLFIDDQILTSRGETVANTRLTDVDIGEHVCSSELPQRASLTGLMMCVLAGYDEVVLALCIVGNVQGY